MFKSTRSSLEARHLRTILIVVVLTALYVVSGFRLFGSLHSADKNLVVVTMGGELGNIQESTIEDHLEDADYAHDVVWAVNVQSHTALYAQIAADNVVWDVITLEAAHAIRACDRGWISPIDISMFEYGSDGSDPNADFVAESLSRCAIGSMVWSLVSSNHCKKSNDPYTARDFFDLANIPGRRGLPRTPKGTLEWALYADGVSPADIYEELGTSAGLERAFGKLDSIRNDVIWWETGSQAAQLVIDGQVAMGLAPSARIVTAHFTDSPSLCIQWSGQIRQADVWAIPSGSKNQAAATEFLNIATTAAAQADVSRKIPYAPARQSAVQLVGTSKLIGDQVTDWLPTSPKNSVEVIAVDATFWADNIDALTPVFYAWLESG